MINKSKIVLTANTLEKTTDKKMIYLFIIHTHKKKHNFFWLTVYSIKILLLIKRLRFFEYCELNLKWSQINSNLKTDVKATQLALFLFNKIA